MSLQKIATIVSSLTALLLLFIKLIVWLFTWSIAVLSSAIDSMLDMFVSLFNYFAVTNSEKNPDKKFNYWRWKIEALAAFIEWIIITLSWIYIFYESVVRYINNEEILYLNYAIYVMLLSVFITFILVLFLQFVVKITDNLVIKSDLLHYKTDLFSNSWILIWLAFIYFTWLNYIDSIIWIIISIYIIYNSFDLIKKWYLLLLDVSLDNNDIVNIINIIKNEKEVNSFHELKTRQSWNIKFVEVHLVYNKDITLLNAHKISDKIERAIINLDSYSWKIMIHMDPYDDSNLDLLK
jgi:ferrous-iron efflux pump FieF